MAGSHGLHRLERAARSARQPYPARSRSTSPFLGLPLRITADSVTLQKYTPIIEPFCNGPKTEVALINVVQVYCYEDTRAMKTFPQILKVCGSNASSASILADIL